VLGEQQERQQEHLDNDGMQEAQNGMPHYPSHTDMTTLSL